MKQSSIEDKTENNSEVYQHNWQEFIKQEPYELIKDSDSGLFTEKRFLSYDNHEKYLILYDEKKIKKKRIKISYLNQLDQYCEAKEIRNSKKDILLYEINFNFQFVKKGLERIKIDQKIELIFKNDTSIMQWHFKKILESKQYKGAVQTNQKYESEQLKNRIAQSDIKLSEQSPLALQTFQTEPPRFIDMVVSNISQRNQSHNFENSVLNVFENNKQNQISEAQYILDFFGIVV